LRWSAIGEYALAPTVLT